jgi:hypothetical protein
VGAGIGAELASMKVTEQIDAIEASAVNPYRLLASTRILACILMLPLPILASDACGLIMGWVTQGGRIRKRSARMRSVETKAGAPSCPPLCESFLRSGTHSFIVIPVTYSCDPHHCLPPSVRSLMNNRERGNLSGTRTQDFLTRRVAMINDDVGEMSVVWRIYAYREA